MIPFAAIAEAAAAANIANAFEWPRLPQKIAPSLGDAHPHNSCSLGPSESSSETVSCSIHPSLNSSPQTHSVPLLYNGLLHFPPEPKLPIALGDGLPI